MEPEQVDILLVEDSDVDLALALRVVSEYRVANSVHAVRDGAEALEYLFCEGRYAHRSPTNAPQLVLLDLHLPEVDGFEVLRRVKSRPDTKHIPVVVMTSSSDQADISATYGLGANSYIVKPVSFDQFVDAFRHIGLYWLVLNEESRSMGRSR